jgi:hypothetical protein
MGGAGEGGRLFSRSGREWVRPIPERALLGGRFLSGFAGGRLVSFGLRFRTSVPLVFLGKTPDPFSAFSACTALADKVSPFRSVEWIGILS